MQFPRSLLLWCFVVGSFANGVAPALAQSQFLLSKGQAFRQVGPSTVVPEPTAPFAFEVVGTVNFGVTLPSGVVSPLRPDYANDGEDEEFIFRRAFSSKAAMDAMFPSGAYRVSGTGIPTLTIDVPEVYPASAPQVTSVSNGNWNAGGLLVVNPAQPTTINLGNFSDYGAGHSYVSISVWGFSEQEDIFELEATNIVPLGAPTLTAPSAFTIPANRLINGRLYVAAVEFLRVPTADFTSVPEVPAFGVVGKSLRFVILAQNSGAAPGAPTIPIPLASRTVATGGTTTFTVSPNIPGVASGNNLALWYKDGFELDTSSSRFVNSGFTLQINDVNLADAGEYMLEVVGPGGTARTSATLTITGAAPGLPRIANLSVLTALAAGDSFTMGYVVGGAGTSGVKPLVIRAAGPSLSLVGVTNPHADPKLELFAGPTKTGENDNWGGNAALAQAMAAVGAFGFASGTSSDAALVTSIATQDNSVRVAGVGSAAGPVLAEVYDATASAGVLPATPRLVNVSVLKHLGTGLTVGFVIDGSSTKTVLVRAVGPTLGAAPFNVPGVIADPQLALFAGQRRVAENNDWGGSMALAAAFTQVGAFQLPTTSKDAALLATLPPGNYSVQVSGVASTSGVAIVEVYEVP